MKTKLISIAVIALLAIALIACDSSSGGGYDPDPHPPGNGTPGSGDPGRPIPPGGGPNPPGSGGPTSHLVTFDTRGGSAIAPVSVQAGSTVATPTDPTRAGFTFAGWFSNTLFTTAFDFNVPVTSVRTAFAGWIPIVSTPSDGVFNFAWNSFPPGPLGWRVTGFSGLPVDPAVIPATRTDGIPVVAVEDGAFFNIALLTSVTIPDYVTEIMPGAFSTNANLATVTIGSNVTTIGNNAFGQSALTSVDIPDSVTTIGNFAFNNNNLSSVIIPDYVVTIGDNAFANNNLSSITIPDSVVTMGGFTFANNTYQA